MIAASSGVLRTPSLLIALLCGFTATATETVVVTARYDNPIGLWDSASEGAITREGIEKRPLLRPGEVLESIPGLIVTQHSGEGKANQYFLRGYNLDHGSDFATWVAGMPVNMPTHAHGQGYTDLNFLIPELIARTLYRKGPYYAEDGDFASAGSAHLDYSDRLPASLASVSAGSFNYRRSLLAGSPDFGGGTLLYGLEYVRNDGGWDHPDKYAKLNGVLRYSQATPDGGLSVTAMAYSADWNSTDQIPRRAVDAGLVSRYGALDPTDGGLASRYSLSAEWRQAAGSVRRAASVYAVRSRLDLFSNFTFFKQDPVNGDQFNQSETRTLAGGMVSQTWYAAAAGRDTSTTAGFQLRQDRISPLALYSTRARQRLAVVREDEARVTSVAPYISNTTAWTDWFRSIAGVRADRFRFEVTSDNPVNSGHSRGSIVSPKLSLVFGPWRNTEYFLNWGTGFHSNDARGTTAERAPPLVRTRGYEAGARSRAIPGFTTTLAFWTLEQDSELLFVGDAGTTEPSRPARRTGLEWLGEYAPNGPLALDTSIALTRARFTDARSSGPFIPGAPDRVASAGITVDGLRGWFGSLRWRYFGPRPLIEDNSVRSQSTSLVNARIGYALDKRTRLSLDVYNLLDRKNNDIEYFYESRLAGESAPLADVHFHPVERRTLRLTLTANL